MINPALTTLSSGLLTFTAPEGTELAADTRYFVAVSCAAGRCFQADIQADIAHTASDDPGAETGWSIDDLLHSIAGNGVLTLNSRALKISVGGTTAVPSRHPNQILANTPRYPPPQRAALEDAKSPQGASSVKITGISSEITPTVPP